MRNSLLSQLLKDNQNLVIDYRYFKSLIDISYYIQNDSKLTDIQRNMIINDFNSIPKFYYSIRTLSTERELNEYKILQMNKISKSINDFYLEPDNLLGREEIEFLINIKGSFGNNLQKNDFLKLLKILPFKYFIFDFTYNIVDFSFPLVKNIFDDFLSNKICDFLISPISSLKEGTIGDILELNLVNDLIKKLFCKIDQILTINSIWNMNGIKSKILKDSKSILLLQDNIDDEYIDFAILNNNEDLLLFQCKKTLQKSPDNFITRKIIEKNKSYLMKNYKDELNVSLKRIFLYYITGITFFMEDNNKKFRIWGVEENENFEPIKNIAKSAEADLFYYDVINRKIYLENNGNFEVINNLIEYSNTYSSPILIELEENIDNKKSEKLEILAREYYNSVHETLKKINCHNKEEFFTDAQKAYLKKYNTEIYNNRIFGYIKEPNIEDINIHRMIGLKRRNKQYLLIEKLNKVKDETEKKGKKGKIENKQEKTGDEIQETLEEKGEEIKSKKENKKRKSLFLVNDNSLEELKGIDADFYEEIDCAFIFENNVILSEI